MNNVFYFFTIFAILFEIANFISPKKMISWTKLLKETSKDDYSGTQVFFIFLIFGYIIWIFVGLFSTQWILFIALLILSFFPFRKYVITRIVDGFLSILILLFILINVYHLHLDIPTLLWNYIK